MNESLFWLVNAVIVAIATGAPVSNEVLNMAPAGDNAEDMIMVGKRAEEMVYYGNQQNSPRVAMKKSMPPALQTIPKPLTSVGEVDEGGKMIVHDDIPVEEDLNSHADAVKGESDIERLAEGMKVAEQQVEEAAALGDIEDAKEGDGSEVKDKKEDANDENVQQSENVSVPGGDAVIVDLPESSGNKVDGIHPVTDMEQDAQVESSNGGDEHDDADEELASLSNEQTVSSAEEEGGDDVEKDEDVENFLDELRKESEANGEHDGDEKEGSNHVKGYRTGPVSASVGANADVDPNYYQTLYHILANTYRGGSPSDDYYNYNMMVPSYYVRRRRRSSLRRHDLTSIRSRRSGQVRRIKRDLPSDWLAAYGGLDIPYSNDIKDSLLSDSDDIDEEDEPVNEELSRYIYANLLNKLYGGNLDTGVENEIPLEEVLSYELNPEINEPLLEEYGPEEILYDPEVPSIYGGNPYDESSYEYRKRSGTQFYPDSRRKRYFYPAYEEPETHWGAFVPEKRSSYDDAIQRLQRLAFALSDNPMPYYQSLLREYKKK